MTETIATVQADTDHTARNYAAMCALADVGAGDLTAWTRYAEIAGPDDPTVLAVTPVGSGFVVLFADELDGHPVASTVAVPAGATPADFGLTAEGIRHVTEMAEDLNRDWAEAERSAAASARLAEFDARWADVEI